MAIGPVPGGFLLVHYWWGSVFLINVPIAALGGLAAIFLIPNSRNAQARCSPTIGDGYRWCLPFFLLIGAGSAWRWPRSVRYIHPDHQLKLMISSSVCNLS